MFFQRIEFGRNIIGRFSYVFYYKENFQKENLPVVFDSIMRLLENILDFCQS